MHLYFNQNLSPCRVVDERILKQSEEDKSDAQIGPDVNGLGVGDGREGLVDGRGRGGHGQQSGHCQSHAGWGLNRKGYTIV